MAQNIVLAWLGGSRLFELKTVQVLDELDIERPCIDMQTIGYNIEWSQELLVHQSLEEYVKAWMMVKLLRHLEPIAELVGDDPGDHVFDMSVGYDLAGIKSEKVSGFIESMRNAADEIERLRPQIGGSFAAFRDLDFDPVISGTVTLIGELNEYAKAAAHRFGIELTNTLVVDNHKGFMPDQTCTCPARRSTCSQPRCSTSSRTHYPVI